jgi:inosine-uridine nucleoside N-ribohydrolase
MGGSINPPPPTFPRWDHTHDYNVQADPTAAKHVLESANPTLVPIEVTVQTVLRRSHLGALRQAGPLGQLIARQAEATAAEWDNETLIGRVYAGLPEDLINFQHDPLACAVALGWAGVTIETLPLSLHIEDGFLRERIDTAGRPLRVVTAVDQERFSTLWLNTVAGPAR